MKYLALFKDAFRESVDNRVLHVLVILSGLFVALCAGVSYERIPEEKVMIDALGHVLGPHREGGRGFNRTIEYEVLDRRPLTGQGGIACRFVLPAKALYNPELADFQQGPARFVAVAYEWNTYNRRKRSGPKPPALRAVPTSPGQWRIEGRDGGPKPVGDTDAAERAFWGDGPPNALDTLDTALGVDFITARLRQAGFLRSRVALLPTDDGSLAFDVTAAWTHRGELKDIEAVTFFGFRIPRDQVSAADCVLTIESTLSTVIAGFFGIGVSIVITSWIFPKMMADGSLALLITKPISRVALFAYKYLAGATFAFLNAALLIGGTWLVLSWRSEWWNGWYLLNIPLLVLVFLVVYSVSVFVGTWTRSTLAALMAAMIAWFLMGMMSTAVAMIRVLPSQGVQVPEKVAKAADIVHTIVPKAGEILDISEAFVLRARGSLDDLPPEQRVLLEKTTPAGLLVPSVLFALFWVALGALIFARRDV